MNRALSLTLLPLSALYNIGIRARRAGYRWGLLPARKLPAPVISVGNLTTGGTGKTPLVEWVCRMVDAVAHEGVRDGKKICVLTRGYGRLNPKQQVVVSTGGELRTGVLQAGDEPLLLGNNLMGIAAVISNPNRLAAGMWAIENLQSEVFVLDDAFQHLQLCRNLDIVTIDATKPWGGGLLPRGRRREPVSGLSRADCVVITRTDQVSDVTAIKKTVRRFVGEAPVLTSRMVTGGVRRVDGYPANRADFLSEPIGAFCGIGNPDSFFEHLRAEGYRVVFTRKFPDHHNYSRSELNKLVEEAKDGGAKSLITTAKDGTKLRSFNLGLPCNVLEIQISIDEEDLLVDLIRKTLVNSA